MISLNKERKSVAADWPSGLKADSHEVHLIQAAALDIFLFFHTPTVCRSYVH